MRKALLLLLLRIRKSFCRNKHQNKTRFKSLPQPFKRSLILNLNTETEGMFSRNYIKDLRPDKSEKVKVVIQHVVVDLCLTLPRALHHNTFLGNLYNIHRIFYIYTLVDCLNSLKFKGSFTFLSGEFKIKFKSSVSALL